MIIEGITQSNKYCVFNFRRHTVLSGKRLKKLFLTTRKCRSDGCAVGITMIMNLFLVVDVYYMRDVHNEVTEKRVRNITSGKVNYIS